MTRRIPNPAPAEKEDSMKGMELLGLNVKDRVTGRTGIITSISFDLFECVQGLMNGGLDKEGKPIEGYWYDVSRLEVLSSKPVMDVPTFAPSLVHGPERKPIPK